MNIVHVTGGCLQFPVSSTTQDGGSERQVVLAQSGSRHNCPLKKKKV